MSDDGGPAFPTGAFPITPGMTLRDWFAGQALAGMLADNRVGTPQQFAVIAFRVAEAMLAARKEPKA